MKRLVAIITILMLLLSSVSYATGFTFSLPASEEEESSEGGVWLDFSTATDEELEEAIAKIQAEQRSRMKTKVVIETKEIRLAKGKSFKNILFLLL